MRVFTGSAVRMPSSAFIESQQRRRCIGPDLVRAPDPHPAYYYCALGREDALLRVPTHLHGSRARVGKKKK